MKPSQPMSRTDWQRKNRDGRMRRQSPETPLECGEVAPDQPDPGAADTRPEKHVDNPAEK